MPRTYLRNCCTPLKNLLKGACARPEKSGATIHDAPRPYDYGTLLRHSPSHSGTFILSKNDSLKYAMF